MSSYLCSCSPRFTGTNCESPVDLCDNHGCGSNAVCSPDFTRLSHVCLCNQDHRPAPGENSTRPGKHCPIYFKAHSRRVKRENESNNFLDVYHVFFDLLCFARPEQTLKIHSPAKVSHQRWISGNVYHVCLRQVLIRQNQLWFWNPEETSPEVQNRGISDPTNWHVSNKNLKKKKDPFTLCVWRNIP